MEDVAGRETGDEEEDQRKATHGVGHVASVDSAQEIARHARWNSWNAMGWRTTEGTVAAPNVEGPGDRATGGTVWESRQQRVVLADVGVGCGSHTKKKVLDNTVADLPTVRENSAPSAPVSGGRQASCGECMFWKGKCEGAEAALQSFQQLHALQVANFHAKSHDESSTSDDQSSSESEVEGEMAKKKPRVEVKVRKGMSKMIGRKQ